MCIQQFRNFSKSGEIPQIDLNYQPLQSTNESEAGSSLEHSLPANDELLSMNDDRPSTIPSTTDESILSGISSINLPSEQCSILTDCGNGDGNDIEDDNGNSGDFGDDEAYDDVKEKKRISQISKSRKRRGDHFKRKSASSRLKASNQISVVESNDDSQLISQPKRKKRDNNRYIHGVQLLEDKRNVPGRISGNNTPRTRTSSRNKQV